MKAERVSWIRVLLWLVAAVLAVVIIGPCIDDYNSHDRPVAQKISCVYNLKQIGLGFRTWALDNSNQPPWMIGTNAGGTMEFRGAGADGFDSNAPLHLLVMSNELSTPLILVCPRDRTKTGTRSFSALSGANVSYRLRTTVTNLDPGPREVLMICPVDGNILYSDGSVGTTNDDSNPDPNAMRLP